MAKRRKRHFTDRIEVDKYLEYLKKKVNQLKRKVRKGEKT